MRDQAHHRKGYARGWLLGVRTHRGAQGVDKDLHRLRNGIAWTVALLALFLAVGLAVPDLHGVLTGAASAQVGWLVAAVAFELLSCLGYVATLRMVRPSSSSSQRGRAGCGRLRRGTRARRRREGVRLRTGAGRVRAWWHRRLHDPAAGYGALGAGKEPPGRVRSGLTQTPAGCATPRRSRSRATGVCSAASAT